MNNYDEACAIGAYKCASRTCANAPYVPKALRRQNFSAHHKRLFTLTAYPSLSALSEANISARRLASIEGNPGIFQTPPRHARALKALTTHDGQHALRLIVGLRDPFDLAFSLWSFLSAIGQEGKRVEVRMGRALAAIQACNDSLAEDPTRLLQLTASELEAYRLCLDDRPRSRQHFYLYGGLYGLHLLGWLHLGYRGSQFLFVRMKSLPREFAQVRPLQTELASFLDLPKPPATMRRDVCLSATMVTSKRQRLRAHNATVADVKRSFKESSTARSLAKFLAGHDALLQALIAREKFESVACVPEACLSSPAVEEPSVVGDQRLLRLMGLDKQPMPGTAMRPVWLVCTANALTVYEGASRRARLATFSTRKLYAVIEAAPRPAVTRAAAIGPPAMGGLTEGGDRGAAAVDAAGLAGGPILDDDDPLIPAIEAVAIETVAAVVAD